MSNPEAAKESVGSPPPYPDDEAGGNEDPPDYDNGSQAVTKIQGPQPPCGHFPAVMNLYGSIVSKTFHLCSADKENHLYAVEVHTGYSMKWPLGIRPGLYLRKGPSSKDPLLAAVGDESYWAARPYAFNLNTVVLLPLLHPDDNPKSLATEMMRAVTAARDTGTAVCFRFSIEAGEKARRQEFEWRKTKESVDNDSDNKTGTKFALALLSPSDDTAKHEPPTALSAPGGAGGSSTVEPSSAPPADRKHDTLAVLTFPKGWSTLTHMFSLHVTGALGERWTLMVVLTALRIWALRVNGRTNKTMVSAGETLHRK